MARLDLDQQVAAHDIGNEAVDAHLELVALPGIPFLKCRVQRLLVQHANGAGDRCPL
jgi:hypothetical protein